MYNTNKVLNSIQKQPKVSNVIDTLSHESIWKQYIGDFKVGRVYRSPLREDKTPSFGIFKSYKDNALLYKDLATGDSGNVFSFIKTLKGFSTMKEVYDDILAMRNNGTEFKLKSEESKSSYSTASISVKRKQLNDIDIAFWKQFNITESILKKFNVSAIKNYIVENKIMSSYKDEDPMYAYKVFDKFKIYRPLGSKSNKWRGNLSSLDIQGFEQLPNSGELLIITKSLKDVMSLYSLGYNAIAPASETSIIPDVVIKNITSRFKKIIIFYDRDSTGFKFTRKMHLKYGFDFMFIHKKYKCKDISDLIKKEGVAEAEKILQLKTKKVVQSG